MINNRKIVVRRKKTKERVVKNEGGWRKNSCQNIQMNSEEDFGIGFADFLESMMINSNNKIDERNNMTETKSQIEPITYLEPMARYGEEEFIMPMYRVILQSQKYGSDIIEKVKKALERDFEKIEVCSNELIFQCHKSWADFIYEAVDFYKEKDLIESHVKLNLEKVGITDYTLIIEITPV